GRCLSLSGTGRRRGRRDLQPACPARRVPAGARRPDAPSRAHARGRQRQQRRHRGLRAQRASAGAAARADREPGRRRRLPRGPEDGARGRGRVDLADGRRHDRPARRARAAAERARRRRLAAPAGAAVEQGRLDRRQAASDEPPRLRQQPRRLVRDGQHPRAAAVARGDVRLAARAPQRDRRARPAAQALLHLERRHRVHGPGHPPARGLPRPPQRGRAQDEHRVLRGDQQRRALLLPRAQQHLHAARKEHVVKAGEALRAVVSAQDDDGLPAPEPLSRRERPHRAARGARRAQAGPGDV
ncbi:MAG: hypothetical protein AVDCRST_MAG67-4141, partial [uncultured Solirubrobacteraceae bacterium]